MFQALLSRLTIPTICALCGVIVGLLIGIRLFAPDTEQEVAEVRVEFVNAARETAAAEVALEQKREAVRTEIRYITKEIVKHVPQTEPHDPARTPDPSCRLSFAAVGLLNAARTGADFQPARYGDAEIKAATDIGLLELSQADIELAAQYRELAANHDALVEYVEGYMAQQRNP